MRSFSQVAQSALPVMRNRYSAGTCAATRRVAARCGATRRVASRHESWMRARHECSTPRAGAHARAHPARRVVTESFESRPSGHDHRTTHLVARRRNLPFPAFPPPTVPRPYQSRQVQVAETHDPLQRVRWRQARAWVMGHATHGVRRDCAALERHRPNRKFSRPPISVRQSTY